MLPIPMSAPDIGPAEAAAVNAVLCSGELSNGGQLVKFEQLLAAYLGARHAVCASSGTAGLHMCMAGAGVKRGDLVLTTPFSFVATTNIIVQQGGTPVFVDVDPRTGNIDPLLLAAAAADLCHGGKRARRWLPPALRDSKVRGRLKALLPVHVYGQPADMDPIMEVGKRHELMVIEDACEALGACYKGRPAGTLGDAAVFGFFPNKQIAAGEGGAIVTNSRRAAKLYRSLRNHGRDPDDPSRYLRVGFNYRLDEMSAAVGAAQMGRIEELLANRARVAAWYGERLAGLAHIELPAIAPTTTQTSWFVYAVRVCPPLDRSTVTRALDAKEIPWRPYFPPIHLLKPYRRAFGYEPGDFPIAERLGEVSLALPFSGVMTEAQVDYVCEVIRSVAK